MWTIIVAGIGLWFLIEGLLYAVFPDAMKQFGAWLSELPESSIRQSGIFSAVLGLVLLYAMVRFG